MATETCSSKPKYNWESVSDPNWRRNYTEYQICQYLDSAKYTNWSQKTQDNFCSILYGYMDFLSQRLEDLTTLTYYLSDHTSATEPRESPLTEEQKMRFAMYLERAPEDACRRAIFQDVPWYGHSVSLSFSKTETPQDGDTSIIAEAKTETPPQEIDTWIIEEACLAEWKLVHDRAVAEEPSPIIAQGPSKEELQPIPWPINLTAHLTTSNT